jgi:hypothetical protein
MMTHEPHPLDIPEFLKRDKNEKPSDDRTATTSFREAKVKRPPNWHQLTKAEQNGTADPVTLLLRRQLELDKVEKRKARFAALKELNEQRKRDGIPVVKRLKPRANKIAAKPRKARKASTVKNVAASVERYCVVTEGGVAFSFDAKGSDGARQILSDMRKRGEMKGVKVKSLRKLKPGDTAVGGGAVPHKEIA